MPINSSGPTFVLIGPYTSASHKKHIFNIGRLYAYYIYASTKFPKSLIHCLPLLTAGFDHVDLWSEDNFSSCLELCDVSTGGLMVPGWQESEGCQKEFKHFQLTKGSGAIVELPEVDLWSRGDFLSIKRKLQILQDYNYTASWGNGYLDRNRTIY